MPRAYRTRGRRAKLTAAKKVEIKEAAVERKRKTTAEIEAERNQRLEDAKRAIALLCQQDDAQRQASLLANRPRSVIEFCKLNGIPEDAPYHPRYNVVGVDPDTDEQRLEGICFGRPWPSEWGGLGAFGHLKN